jgi:hypothetical protein
MRLPNDNEMFAENVKHTMLPPHVKNCFENYQRLKERYGKTVFEVPSGKRHGPAIIVGSGQTLDDSFELLRQWQAEDKGIIVCSSSQISTLYYHGIKPELCVVFDSKTSDDMFSIREIDYEYTSLIVHPGVPSSVLDLWEGNIYVYRLTGGNDFNQYLKHAYDFLALETMPFATALATQAIFAVYMGFAPLNLVGVDMQGDRFLRYYWDNGWKTEDWRKDEEGKNNVQDGDYRTSQAMMYHKKGLLTAFRIDLVSGGYPVFNCSDKSIVRELPYRSLEDVVNDPAGWTDWPVEEKIDKIDTYLDSRYSHVVTVNNGYAWVSKVLVGEDEELTQKFHETNREVTDHKKKLVETAKREKKTLKEIAPNFDPQKVTLIDIPAHWKRIKELRNG